MSDLQKILIVICFNIATVIYVKLFKHRIKEGFQLLIHPFKEMDRHREEQKNALVGTMKATASFLMFWLGVKLAIYSAMFNVLTIYRWVNGQPLFGS